MEKGGGELKANFSSFISFSGAAVSWNKKTRVAAPDQDRQMNFHVLTCPKISGQTLKVRWTEQRPITSHCLESPGIQPRKNEVLTLFDPHLSRSPWFLEPLSGTFQRALFTGWGLGKFWYLGKDLRCLCEGQWSHHCSLGKSFNVSWKLNLGRTPFYVPWPFCEVSIPFYFFRATFFLKADYVVVTVLSALENDLSYL